MIRNGRGVYVTVGLLALTLGLVTIRYAPPEAIPIDAPANHFSADRAFEVLRSLVSNDTPHPTGTEANAVVRLRVVSELRTLGYQPHIQEAFACNPHGTCGYVKNVVAMARGTTSAPAVLLAVHYDSVGAGPGASDDAVGVAAALEVARALKNSPPLKRDVIFLIDDGEEQGLLGAEAFCARHPWARRVGSVVNLEARGTTGPSLMFETNRRNAAIVGSVARALPRPATNSIYYTIYQLLPNDTDFTVFKRYGLNGANFAFVGGAARYHTPRDDLAHVDRRSLQHHGDNALALVRAFASDTSQDRAKGDATYFDFLTLTVVSWPASWTPILAVVGALLVLSAVFTMVRRSPLTIGGVLRGMGSFVLVVIITGACAWTLHAAIAATKASGVQWLPHSWALRAAFWMLPFAVSSAVMFLFRNRTAAEMWSGVWITWSVIAIGTGFVLPGTAYPFVIPTLLAGAFAVVARKPNDGAVPAWAAQTALALSAGVLILPVAWMLYDGMGVGILPAVSILVLLVFSCALPSMTGEGRGVALGTALVGGLLTVVAAIIAAVLPSYSVDHPRPLSFIFYERVDQKRAQWLTGSSSGALPVAMRSQFLPRPIQPYPWSKDVRLFSAPARQSWLDPHVAVIASVERHGDEENIVLDLRPARPGSTLGIYMPAERLTGASVEGVEIPLKPERQEAGEKWRRISVAGAPAAGIGITLRIHGLDPVPVFTWELDYGIPASGNFLKKLRPLDSVPSHAGDRSMVVSPLVIE